MKIKGKFLFMLLQLFVPFISALHRALEDMYSITPPSHALKKASSFTRDDVRRRISLNMSK